MPQRGGSCPAYPAYRDTYSPMSPIVRRSHGLGTYVPLVRHTSPAAVTVSPVSEAARVPARGGTAARGRGGQPAAHPGRGRSPGRGSAHDHGRDRRRGRRRTLDALPPLPDARGATAALARRARKRGEAARAPAPAWRRSRTRRPGSSGRDRPLALEVTHVLDEVPPHLVPDQLVAEARRAAGVAVALYVVDIDGSQLIRLAGSEDFPDRARRRRPRSGPRSCPRGCPRFSAPAAAASRGCVVEPLWLRGRVIGLLLVHRHARRAAGGHRQAGRRRARARQRLHRRHRGGAPAQADDRRPPRSSRTSSRRESHASPARSSPAACCPTYEVGGDWFDFVENRDGAWLAIADAAGTGPTAAGLGAAALGALRAARRSGKDLEDAARSRWTRPCAARQPRLLRHRADRPLARRHQPPSPGSTAAIRRPTSSTATAPHRARRARPPALGTGDDRPTSRRTERQLAPGERLILVTDGITERRTKDGGSFGVDGIAARSQPRAPTAAPPRWPSMQRSPTAGRAARGRRHGRRPRLD